MSSGAFQWMVGVACAMGLAGAGLGWQVEVSPPPDPPEAVYCNIDGLLPDHPAWEQLVQLDDASRYRQHIQSEALTVQGDSTTAISDASQMLSESTSREKLESMLDARTEQGLQTMRGRMEASADRRLEEIRCALVEQAAIVEIASARDLESDVADRLREFNLQEQYERLDLALKLSALKSQLSAQGVSRERVSANVEMKTNDLKRLDENRRRNEDGLRADMEAFNADIKARDAAKIEEVIDGLRSQSQSQIAEEIESLRTSLVRDAGGSVFGAYGAVEANNIAASTDRVRPSPKNYVSSKSASAKQLGVIRTELRERAISELRLQVARIARDNGLRVVFVHSSELRDRTEWFRARLPYDSVSRDS